MKKMKKMIESSNQNRLALVITVPLFTFWTVYWCIASSSRSMTQGTAVVIDAALFIVLLLTSRRIREKKNSRWIVNVIVLLARVALCVLGLTIAMFSFTAFAYWATHNFPNSLCVFMEMICEAAFAITVGMVMVLAGQYLPSFFGFDALTSVPEQDQEPS